MYNDDTYSGMDVTILAGMMLFMGFFALIAYVINAVALMMLLKRAGHPRAWAAWVPFYSTYTIYQFGGQKPLWFWIYLGSALIAGLPLVGPLISFAGGIAASVAMVYAIIFINKSFGKGDDLVLWTIFGFLLFPIWALVLAMSTKTFAYMPADGPVLLGGDGTPPRVW